MTWASYRCVFDGSYAEVWDMLKSAAGGSPPAEGVTDITVLEQFDDGLLRRVRAGDLVWTERVEFDEDLRVATFAVVDAPEGLSGTMRRTVKAVPWDRHDRITMHCVLDWQVMDPKMQEQVDAIVGVLVRGDLIAMKSALES